MAFANHLSSVSVRGLHGHTHLSVSLRDGLNIVYGINGAGKTTLLHIIANLLNGDIERFCRLTFDSIEVSQADGSWARISRVEGEFPSARAELSDGNVFTVQASSTLAPERRAHIVQMFGGRPVYLPAFRGILEAATRARQSPYFSPSEEDEAERVSAAEHDLLTALANGAPTPLGAQSLATRNRMRAVGVKTALCRNWFGAFVPVIRFPSLRDVTDQLAAERQEAQFQLAQHDQQALADVFVKALRALLQGETGSDSVNIQQRLNSLGAQLAALQSGSGHLPREFSDVRDILSRFAIPAADAELVSRVLRVYEDALRSRVEVEKSAFARLRTFEQSMNSFLTGKSLSVESFPRERATRALDRPLELADGRRAPFSVLSSGERHLLTLIFSATHMGDAEGVLLVDEPELSLHIDWQRRMLTEVMRQSGRRQIVVCTHAPEITADHFECMRPLALSRLGEDE